MADEIVYMLGIVGVGFAVNYLLRALPFLLFAGRHRELPKAVERFGAFISPVIIGCLIVYSYSGAAWRTPWPYLAGAVTVALQVWRKNPLVSIVAGTAVYMLLGNCCGCASRPPLEFDGEEPPFRVSQQGYLCGDRFVTAQEAVEVLRDYEVPTDRTICIRIDPDVRDLKPARYLMSVLSRSGYRRPVLVTKQHSESLNLGVQKRPAQAGSRALPAPKKSIRYKRADE